MRRFLRVGLGGAGLSCEVCRDGIDASEPVQGQLMVLGEGGAFLKVMDRFGVGDTLNLRLDLPGEEDEQFVCQGTVIEYVEGEGIGVEFKELNADAHKRLRTAVLQWAIKP